MATEKAMTLAAIRNQLYRQLELPNRTEARDKKIILKALKAAQKVKGKK